MKVQVAGMKAKAIKVKVAGKPKAKAMKAMKAAPSMEAAPSTPLVPISEVKVEDAVEQAWRREVEDAVAQALQDAREQEFERIVGDQIGSVPIIVAKVDYIRWNVRRSSLWANEAPPNITCAAMGVKMKLTNDHGMVKWMQIRDGVGQG